MEAVSTRAGGVARAARTVAAATLASRVLGLARDVALANVFPARATDAFFVAFMIPNLLRRLLGEGTLGAAFVPVFEEARRRSEAEARRLFGAAAGAAVGATALLALAGIAFAEPLVTLFAPGFRADAEKFAACAALLRLCFPYVVLLVWVAIAMAALNALGHFLAPAASPALLNVALLAACAAAAGRAEPPVLLLGWAVLAAGLAQVIAQFPPLRRRGLPLRPVAVPCHPGVRRLAALILPAVWGASIVHVNVLVARILASFLGDGAISYLYYAGRLLDFPLGVFVFALGTASLPALARDATAGRRREAGRTAAASLRMALVLAVPSSLGLALLAERIFAVLFAWNPTRFGVEATGACAAALAAYAVGLVPIAASRILGALCIAHQDTRGPAVAATAGVAVHAAAALALVGPLDPARAGALAALQRPLALAAWGTTGLALAASVAAAANAAWLAARVARRYGAEALAVGWGASGRIAAASVALVAALEALEALRPGASGAGLAGLADLALRVAAGAAAYLGALAALGGIELRELAGRGRRPGAPRPGEPPEA